MTSGRKHDSLNDITMYKKEWSCGYSDNILKKILLTEWYLCVKLNFYETRRWRVEDINNDEQ